MWPWASATCHVRVAARRQAGERAEVVVVGVRPAPELEVEVGEVDVLAVGVHDHVTLAGTSTRRQIECGTRQSWLPGQHDHRHVEAGELVGQLLAGLGGHPVVVEEVADEQHDVDARARSPRRRRARRRCRATSSPRRGGRRRAAGAGSRRHRCLSARTAASWSAAGPVVYGPSRQASAARRPVGVDPPAELGHRRGQVGDGVVLGALERGEPRAHDLEPAVGHVLVHGEHVERVHRDALAELGHARSSSSSAGTHVADQPELAGPPRRRSGRR